MARIHDGAERPASRADVPMVLQALARILEHAARSHAGGFDPDFAILLALNKHEASLALECVARAAWALAVRSDHTSTGRAQA